MDIEIIIARVRYHGPSATMTEFCIEAPPGHHTWIVADNSLSETWSNEETRESDVKWKLWQANSPPCLLGVVNQGSWLVIVSPWEGKKCNQYYILNRFIVILGAIIVTALLRAPERILI